MGLDWLPRAPRKDNVREDVYKACEQMLDEKEKEVEALMKTLKDTGQGDVANKLYSAISDYKGYQQKYHDMTVSKAEVMEIPKVGYDDEATKFILKHRKSQVAEAKKRKKAGGFVKPEWAEYWGRSEAHVLVDQWGKGIGDLAKTNKGAGAVTGFMLVGADSFRGKCLNGCEFMGELDSYKDMTANEMKVFADTLEEQGKAYAKEHKHDWEKVGKSDNCEETDDEVDKQKYSIWIAYQAIQWLRFWASHGFSMHAWY
jgi:hypothetical protein